MDHDMRKLSSLALILSLAAAPAAQAAGDDASDSGEPIVFRHALTGEPLDMNMRPDQEITEAVEIFHETGENPYSGDPEAIEAGEEIYNKQCASCHLKDGTGRIGPNLTDDIWTRERTDTQIGRFEVIYGGGAGAMQAFGRRIDPDEILKVMAYIDTFRQE